MMKIYIGTKEVRATPAWRIDGVVYPKYGDVPQAMNREDGYKVIHEDGCESWSPKEVFEKTYKPAETRLDRMKIELSELECRLEKLESFMESEEYFELPLRNRALLARQYNAMDAYYSSLVSRIRLEKYQTNSPLLRWRENEDNRNENT